MEIKIKVFVLITICIILSISMFLFVRYIREDDVLIRVALMPSSSYGAGECSDVYYLTLNSKRVLVVSKIQSRGENIDSSEFVYENFDKRIRKLSKDEMASIVELVNKVFSSGYIPRGDEVYDSWTVIISNKGKSIADEYYEPLDYYRPAEFQELISLLMKLSPIPIELRGFA